MPKKKTTDARRLLMIQSEFMRNGEDLGLKDGIAFEFPDAKEGEEPGSRPDKYMHFIVHLHPKGGFYDGGVFRFDFDIRNVPEYPNNPPKVTCLTRVWHPNIAMDGRVCHNYLQGNEAFGEGCGYSSSLGLKGLVLGISTMFDVDRDHHSDSFNPNDPLNTEAAQMFVRSPSQFERQARDYTKKYAQPVTIKPYCRALMTFDR